MDDERLHLTELGSAWARSDLPATRELLRSTYAAPEAYDRALMDHLNATGLQLRSQVRRIDLFGDLVGRHLAQPRAFVFAHASEETWRELSYRELDEETARLATSWLRKGLQAGARLALLTPPGPKTWLALLTALRLGVTPVVFPFGAGRGYIRRRLLAHRPAAVATGEEVAAALDIDLLEVPVRAPPGLPPTGGLSHRFEALAPALEVHSGFQPAVDGGVSISAGQLASRLGTDAFLTFQLRAGMRMAAPGLEPSRHQTLPLACLFAGATWVEASGTLLEERPTPVELMGVSTDLRDRVLEHRVKPKGWRRWFKDPSEPHDWSAWRAFENALPKETRGQNVVYASALGGALLSSPPTEGLNLEVLPSPGLPWVLEEPGVPGQPTESPSGVLALSEGQLGVSTLGRFLLSDAGDSYMYSGSLLPGPRGTDLPAVEIESVAEGHPIVDAAVLLVNPDPGRFNAVTSTLLLFVDPAREPEPVAPHLARTVEDMIRRDMGFRYVPDRVVAHPLTPRYLESGLIDREWCRFQQQTGGLTRRRRSEIHRLTSLLRRWGAQRAEGRI